jgi:hypothetical protein
MVTRKPLQALLAVALLAGMESPLPRRREQPPEPWTPRPPPEPWIPRRPPADAPREPTAAERRAAEKRARKAAKLEAAATKGGIRRVGE